MAIVAGAIHTGRLPAGKDPGAVSFRELPFLNMQDGGEGEIFVIGKDDRGNDIYALSIKGERGMPHRLVESFLRIYKIPRGNLLMIDSGVGDNFFLLAGRLLNRAGFLAALGRFFTYTGIKKMYGELTRLSAGVRDGLGKSLD
ncbi:DUF3189 family protein [Pelotomaculum sp. FP]|uniref:DUF3189 family protein n=1 Tax=Pelotomaculum sp. FP TaxID=261474 RepID=UPI001863EFBA|nr:DUF3189 family protein [Pelotomaculum sp. FP]